MLDINLAPLREGFARFLPVGIVIAILMVVAMGTVFNSVHFNEAQLYVVSPAATDVDNARALGKLMFTEYLYPFEIAGAILLVAIVAAISLTLRKGRPRKSQDPSDQVRVRREDRVRIVKMDAEKKSG